MSSKVHSFEEAEGEENLFSKVLNGMKSVFNNAGAARRSGSRRRSPIVKRKLQTPPAPTPPVTDDDAAIVIPIYKNSANQETDVRDGYIIGEFLPSDDVNVSDGISNYAVLSVNPDFSITADFTQQIFMSSNGQNVDSSYSNSNVSQNAIEDSDRPKTDAVAVANDDDLNDKLTDCSVDDPSENKPRIVLKFRSDKSGYRNSNMKIVSDGEKAANRRSLRGKSIMNETKKDSNSESDDGRKNSTQSGVKRSVRRSKDYSENVLANAIARKEKSYEASNSGQTRLSRRIKPTAKVLANRELRLGLETQNNARLGIIDKSKPDEGKVTRSKLKKATENKKNQKKITNTTRSSDEERVEKVQEERKDRYLSSDEINRCILGPAYQADGKKGNGKKDSDDDDDDNIKIKSKSKESPYEEDKEHKRINKLKKKHLKKLGLKAVSGHNRKKVARDRETFTDESTMDSTNTEAIIEHLNSRAKTLNSSSTEKSVKTSEKHDEETIKTQSKKLRSNKHKRKISISDSEIDEDDKLDLDDEEEVSIRVTRKRSRMSNSNSNEHNDPHKVCSKEEESVSNITSCFCTAKSNLYADPNSLTDVEFCKAVEFVGGRVIGCGRKVSVRKLVRAGPRAPFFVACDMHHFRLLSHHCCAGCGVFCSHGTHYRCSEGHLFHWECGLPFVPLYVPTGQTDASQATNEDHPNQPRGTMTDLYNSEPGCPHCGVNDDTMEPINVDCVKVTLETKCSNPMVLLPSPRLQWIPATMSFAHSSNSRSIIVGDDDDDLPLIPDGLIENIKESLDKIIQKRDNTIDYDDLLIKVNRDNQKDMNLIKAVCDKENSAESIIDAINSGGNPKRRIPHVDDGTFMHLAARELNMCALYIFRMIGCELNPQDGERRTPLMLAVMNYDTEIVDKMTDKDDESNENVELPEDDSINEELKDENEAKELVGQSNEYKMVVNFLLKSGADVSIKGPNGATVLHLSSKYGDILTCSKILKVYAKFMKKFINQTDDGGWTPLVWAVENQRQDVVRFLLEKGADPTLRDSENNTALHWAAMVGCKVIMEDLLKFGSHVNASNRSGDTPLHLSARHDHHKCVVVLLAWGAQVIVKNLENETPLDCVSDDTSDCYSTLAINEQIQKVVNDNQGPDRILSEDISNGKENVPVKCVNNVDDENLNGKFSYITKNCFTVDIKIDRKINSMQTCQCKEMCEEGSSDCSCSNLSMKCWYNANGRLVSDFDYDDPPMIFECNDACSCHKLRCINRCLDKGLRVSLKVFRQTENTARGGGWGVCTSEPILKGTLVSEYVGEILPGSLAYHRADDSYLFELELKDDIMEDSAETYCLDAKNYGNVSRFINHKCEPNLVPVRLFVDHRDLHFPRVAFFACKDIKPGEELGFDYGSKFWKIKIKSFTCHCDSAVCRYDKKTNSEDEATEAEDVDQESE